MKIIDISKVTKVNIRIHNLTNRCVEACQGQESLECLPNGKNGLHVTQT